MRTYILIFLFSSFLLCNGSAQSRILEKSIQKEHPRLILTPEAVTEISKDGEHYPLMKNSILDVMNSADWALKNEITTPFPKDAGGGYTHEKHKQNYMDMYHAGIAFQISGELKYAKFVEEMLLKYAEMYPSLGIHPEKENQSPGKLFWQGLNETVWLVHSIQAYDNVMSAISKPNRKKIEKNVFRPMVHFFTVEDNYSFNRVHNHGTWAVAAVGMTGIVLGEEEWVKQALWSSDLSGHAGFFKQLDQLFSPDGYYAEGPYYQRYALLPFVTFSQALDNNYPQLRIFEYRDSLIEKIVNTTLQLTDDRGYFFPYNNSIKGKSFISNEIVIGVDVAYSLSGNPGLLDVAQQQGRVMISAQGLKVARDQARGLMKSFKRESVFFRDGSTGKEGGVAIIRNQRDSLGQTLLFKFASQGMGHGHFDRLQYLFYDQGDEIIGDYGAARFVNIEPKYGGRYLPENNSWAKQTIAHNTVTLNRKSHFDGKLSAAEKYSPSLLFDIEDSENGNHFIAAVDSNAYKSTILRRAMALVNVQGGAVVLDVFDVISPGENVADYSTYYKGQVIHTTVDYTPFTTSLVPFGKDNGYQFLWWRAESERYDGIGMEQFSFLYKNSFYTLSTVMDAGSTLNFVEIGANDPNFNLRNEPGLILSQPFSDRHTFVSIIEPHGSFDPVTEMVIGSDSKVKNLELTSEDGSTFLLKANIGESSVEWEFSFDPNDSICDFRTIVN